MDREKVIKDGEETIKILGKIEEHTFWIDFVRNSVENMVHLLKENGEQRWIHVTERLPKDGEIVLFIGHNKYGNLYKVQRGAYYSFSGWYSDITGHPVNGEGKVTYWMPLPEPPKEG